jgi:1,4-dihydroxy-2-naphthoyl-CoA hydrolase
MTDAQDPLAAQFADSTRAGMGPFIDYLGLTIVSAAEDELVARWEARRELHQPYGLVHGGVHCSVVETLASFGASLWLGERGKVVGVNNNTDFLRAVESGVLVSRAVPIHRGRSQQLWLVETRDEAERVVARGQVRLQNLYPTTP